MTAFYAFLLAVVGGIISALVTVQLSLWQFHSEKWWEKKADIYGRLIEAFYNVFHYNAVWLENRQWDTGNASPETEKRRQEQEKIALEKSREASAEIQRLRIIGAFVISDEIAVDLSNYWKDDIQARRRIEEDLDEGVEMVADNAKKYLEIIREHAKADLGQKRKLLPLT